MTDINPMLKAALEFYAAGCSVVPARIDGTKAPIGEWKKYQSERATVEQIVAWYSNGHEGLGIVTGAISGNLEVLEIEGRAVDSGIHKEAKEIAEASGLSELWSKINNGYVEKSAGGGIHWLYRVEGMELPGNTKLARRPGENGGVDVLAETRSSGGYIITAPSHGGTHPKGTAWEMVAGSASTIPIITADEREALHDLFKVFDQMPERAVIAEELKPRKDGVLTPGDDFNARTTWESLIKPLGWKIAYKQGEKTAWTRPGKDYGVSATTNYQGTDKFRVFSTSTIFEAERSYDKFGAYALIRHNGDFRAAASDLRNQGYGAQGLNSFDLGKSRIGKSATDTPQEGTEADLEGFTTSWEPIDLDGYFDGLFTLQEATLLKRTDGQGLLYPGKVHSFYGESESGKSWLAQIAAAEVVKSYQKVVYIDFESDAVDIANRLKILGVTKPEAMQYFRYIRPERKVIPDDPAWLALVEEGSATLIIIDGVTEALTMWEKATKENDDITEWMRKFPRALAKSGAAVVLIDHITKNPETRGRFALGGQAKLATIDGAAYLIEPIKNLAPGGAGALTVRVTKDRPGAVRRNSGIWRKSDRTQEAAIIEVDSTGAIMKYVICVPMSEDEVIEDQELKMEKAIATFIATHPGCTKGEVTKGVKGGDHAIYERLEAMLSTGSIADEGKGRGFAFYLTDAGGQKYQLKLASVTAIGGGNLG